MAAGGDRDLRGADPEVGEVYALVGEFPEAYAGMGSAITEFLVGAIGIPEGAKDALREVVENSHARERLLIQYASCLGFEIKVADIGGLRKARNMLAHNIVGVNRDGVRALKGGHEDFLGREDLQRYVMAARRITRDLEARGAGALGARRAGDGQGRYKGFNPTARPEAAG